MDKFVKWIDGGGSFVIVGILLFLLVLLYVFQPKYTLAPSPQSNPSAAGFGEVWPGPGNGAYPEGDLSSAESFGVSLPNVAPELALPDNLQQPLLEDSPYLASEPTETGQSPEKDENRFKADPALLKK
jgi:hypothetical protein